MDDGDGGWISVRSVVVNELRRCGGAVGRAACREWRKEGSGWIDGWDQDDTVEGYDCTPSWCW